MIPLVSIIIPNYNHKQFLLERIESVLNQTFQNFEILIFDDASTDGSIEVLELFKEHPKVSHFAVNKINSGTAFKQWHKGLVLAKGKYIWIAETDDYADDQFLDKTLTELQENESLALCYTDSDIVNELGEHIGIWSKSKNDFFKTQRWSANYRNYGLDEVMDFLLYKVTINNVSAVLFNKSFFEKLEFDVLEQFRNAGDLFTYLSLCLNGNISYIAYPLNNYREHSANFTKNNIINGVIYKERLNCFNFVLDFLSKSKLNKIEKARAMKALHYFIHKNGFNLLDFNYSNELRNLLSKSYHQGFVSFFQLFLFQIGVKMYYSKFYKLNGISRKLIKKTFT